MGYAPSWMKGRYGHIMSHFARLDQVSKEPSRISRPETTGTLSSCIKHSLVLRAQMEACIEADGGVQLQQVRILCKVLPLPRGE